MQANKMYSKLLRSVFSDGFGGLGMPVHLPSLTFVLDSFDKRGIEFLTLDLPALEADFLVCLADREIPEAWPQLDTGEYFLSPLLGPLIGGLHPVNPEDQLYAARCLKSIRQILLLFSKMKILPTQERVDRAVDGWFEVEETLRDRRAAISEAASPAFVAWTRSLFRPLFTFVSNSLATGNIPWGHGPGSVAEQGLYGVRKFSVLYSGWTARAAHLSSRWSSTLVGLSEYEDRDYDDSLPHVSPRDEQNMRITLVPKTAKSPRIIAMEPTVIQWGQQALMRLFSRGLRTSDSFIGLDWNDQRRNQELARYGSVTGSLATLDLSEASDRLHLLLVQRILPPSLRRWVFGFRSTRATFKDRVIRLEKFAPMGSAMCFVMESILFYSISSYAIQIASGMGLSQQDVSKRPVVSVYGDDIIVPTEYALDVANMLEAFGLKVNLNKSFWNGYFRESCGKDFLHGHDVTVVRARYPLDNIMHPDATMSLVSAQNEFWRRGWFNTASTLRSFLRHVPSHSVPMESGYACLSDNIGDRRWNLHLQRLEYKVVIPKYRVTVGDGWDAMRNWLQSVLFKPTEFQLQHGMYRPKPMGLGYSWSTDHKGL